MNKRQQGEDNQGLKCSYCYKAIEEGHSPWNLSYEDYHFKNKEEYENLVFCIGSDCEGNWKRANRKPDRKMKDCSACTKEIKERLSKCESWEIKRKEFLNNRLKNDSCICGSDAYMEIEIGGGTEKFCKKCKESYLIRNNYYQDIEPDKHANCFQRGNDNNREREREQFNNFELGLLNWKL